MQYRALQNILRDGKTITPGTLIDLNDTEAAQLLDIRAIEPAPRRFSREITVPGMAEFPQAGNPLTQP